MIGVNPFGVDDDIQDLLVKRDNWDFVFSYLERPGPLPAESFLKITNLMPAGICALLRMICETHQWLGVGKDGDSNKATDKIGNYRLSNWNPELAGLLWDRIAPYMSHRTMDAFTPTDHEGHARWKPVGVSPLFRFIRYQEGGELIAHYDATYKEHSERRTLMSMVIYLTTNEHGATRFLKDPQAGKAMVDMDFSDWDRTGNDDEVILRCNPRIGDAIIFDHRMLHDGEALVTGDPEKVIIRTDIIFEKV